MKNLHFKLFKTYGERRACTGAEQITNVKSIACKIAVQLNVFFILVFYEIVYCLLFVKIQ